MAITPTPAFVKSTSLEPAKEPANTPAMEPEGDSPKKRNALRWILRGAGILVLLAAIVGGVEFARYSRHQVGAGLSAAIFKKSSTVEQKTSTQVAIDLPLDPFVVNLADAGGHSYARIGLTLHLATLAEPRKSASTENDAANDLRDMVRDQIIEVLNRQQSVDLLAPNGKEHLKQAIEAAITAKSPRVHVIDIYFTQFLVQS